MVKRESEKMMKIGMLAQAAHCSVETIRYYETEGLLPPPERGSNNYRMYGTQHLQRLIFIRNCRALDMSQKEIIGLLRVADVPNGDCGSVNTLLDEHIAHVEIRLHELQCLKEQLIRIRKKCHQSMRVSDCRILQGLSEIAHDEIPSQRTTHLS